MNFTKRGIKFIKEVEGCENRVYRCVAGKWTIGVGHVISDMEKKAQTIFLKNGPTIFMKNNTITDEEVDQLLEYDLGRFITCIKQKVKVPLQDYQFEALVSFAFNVGEGAFTNSTLLKVLNQGQYNQVPKQLERWNKANGKVVQGLVNRREKEIQLWNNQY